ncbi:hypothetical protein HO133_001282 [Letharia lupina]|uniref:Heterokaryon incompatibility domain-containing protein n=1 Tax=Letharia lupina TaxID=560253 RepID=A0A8H6CFD3_9LECA|nr:uncharacterized protein HO133_001282 [Letharia lupina]KAF6222196.1 hypothetical protein HO133_001282 [Letharia lupina]
MSFSSRDDLRIPFNETAKDLFLIFQRGWFRRIWVIHEVSVCRKATVVCGPLTIDLEDLSAALFAVAVLGKVIDGPWRKTSYAIFEQRKEFDETKRPHLSQLIDKIYAVLGLADEASQHQVTISYDTTTQDVYQKVALSCLAYDQSLSILGSVEAVSASKSTSLPSWVPDWSVPRTAYTLTFHNEFSSTRATYMAARASQYAWKQPKSNRGLVLTGFQLDRIIVVGYADKHSIAATDFTKRQYLDIGRAKLLWQLSCERVAGVRSKKQNYVTGEDMFDAYWQTLCAGCTLETFNTRFIFPRFGIRPPVEWKGFSDRMVFAMGKCMARTSKGSIGLVPATTQPGDCVWL